MKKISNAKASSVKALAIETQLFAMTDKLNDQTLRAATPTLVKMLQRYDRLCGFRRSTDVMCAIDVRLSYVMFKRFREETPKEQQKMIKDLECDFAEGQLQAIQRSRLRLVKGVVEELNPIALAPLFRRSA